jgi:hypothetical protein
MAQAKLCVQPQYHKNKTVPKKTTKLLAEHGGTCLDSQLHGRDREKDHGSKLTQANTVIP